MNISKASVQNKNVCVSIKNKFQKCCNDIKRIDIKTTKIDKKKQYFDASHLIRTMKIE